MLLRLLNVYRELYVTTGKWPLFEGMRDLIDDLHAAGKKVAVASSKNQPMLEMGLRDNNLIGVLDTYAGRIDEAATDKITAIAYVMRQLGFEASESVMIGDRRFDMEQHSQIRFRALAFCMAKLPINRSLLMRERLQL